MRRLALVLLDIDLNLARCGESALDFGAQARLVGLDREQTVGDRVLIFCAILALVAIASMETRRL
ncbi:hypothetical protein NEI07_02245 [Methylocystis sp. NLS-7]|nr:hypothetical protein [Methylocystis suflitae]MCQ4188428.1 hypothetical protein [Methylocystis suflitae]